MRKKDRSESTDPDELATYLLEMMARKDLSHFLEMFRKDFHSKMDFKKGYQLLDDELPDFVAPAQLEQSNAFTLFVKATRKTGESCRFLVHTIWMGDAKFALGIAEVPDGTARRSFSTLNWN